MKYAVEKSSLSALADAIREKTGKTDLIPLFDMPGEIRSIEGGGILLSDNLVVPPENPFEGDNYTVNSNGTVTVPPAEYPQYPVVYFTQGMDSFLPMENGKTYKLTVTPSNDVKSVDVRLIISFTNWGDWKVESYFLDFKEGNSVTFTVPDSHPVPEYPWFLDYISVPTLLDKNVTYTFDLREVLDEEVIYEDGFEAGYNKATAENPFYYTYILNTTFAAVTFPENYDFVLRLKNQIGFQMPFQKARNIKSIKFIADDKTSIKRQAYGWFQWCYEVEMIDLSEYGIVTLTGDCRSMFQECSKLKTVKGVLDFTDVINWYQSALNCKALEDIEFVPNSINISIGFNQSTKLSKTSITSIINGLNGDATEQTLTLSKTAVNNAFGINVDDETTWTDEWNNLRNSKSNWTFSFA